MHATITGIGAYVPEKVLDNAWFEERIETNDEWIRSRTGIKTRRMVAEGQQNVDLCYEAAQDLARRYNKDLSQIDFILVATITPDQVMPTVASQLQNKLGLVGAGALDISAACAGFSYGLIVARGLVETGAAKNVLVIGSECLTRVVDYTDRATCILFGDGAGAFWVEAGDTPTVIKSLQGAEGDKGKELYLSTNNNIVNETEIIANGFLHQDGRKVFRWAVGKISEYVKQLIADAGLQPEDIDWFVPHSANMRIIEALAKTAGIPVEKTLESVSVYGNTSSASIPLAIHRGVEAGKLKKGDKVLVMGFGGGLSYAGMIFEWA